MAKSMIADLQAELAQKRKRVEECEEALRAERTAAEEYVRKKIGKAEVELDEAKRDAEAFVATIAQAIGLPNPTEAREAKIRLRRVRELVAEGKAEAEIAAELGVTVAIVAADVARLTPRPRGDATEPEEGQRGWKRDQVRRLSLEGKSNEEIARRLGISVSSVNAHLYQLRAQGKLPATLGARPAPTEHDDESDEDEADERQSQPQTHPTPQVATGDTIEDLRAEVVRQQGSQRAKAVKLIAANHEGHYHRVLVDRMGDGYTQSDNTGHIHKVYRFVVSMGAKHQHGLRVPTAAELAAWG